MTIPDSDFAEYRASKLGAYLFREPAGLPVKIELQDADGNVLGSSHRLFVTTVENEQGMLVAVKIVGRVTRPVDNPG